MIIASVQWKSLLALTVRDVAGCITKAVRIASQSNPTPMKPRNGSGGANSSIPCGRLVPNIADSVAVGKKKVARTFSQCVTVAIFWLT